MWEDIATDRINEDVLLYEGRVLFVQGDRQMEGEGSVSIQWLRHPWVITLMRYESLSSRDLEEVRFAPAQVTLLDLPGQPTLRGQGSPHAVKYSAAGGSHEAIVRVNVEGSEFVDSGTPLVSATAHLVNFPQFLFREVPASAEGGALSLRTDDWKLIIRPVANLMTLTRALEREGGYAITHRVEVARSGRSFTGDELREILGVLHDFLSFARGAWCTPVGAVGIGTDGSDAWSHWGIWNVSAGPTYTSWWDIMHPESLEQLLAGFVTARRSLDREMAHSIYWYIVANITSSPETAVILAQVALELLSWTVQFKRDANGWKEAKYSSRRLRMLLEKAGIPTAIPATMSHLVGYALDKYPRQPEMRTGPIVLTDYRNDIVHPDRPGAIGDHGWELGYQARELALWYLELALLRVCRYKGDYVSRPMKPHVIGQVDQVPWGTADLEWPYV